jgi:Protein kinase domain
MSEVIDDLNFITFGSLKTKVAEKGQLFPAISGRILKDPLEIPIAELFSYYDFIKTDPDFLKYLLGLITLKASIDLTLDINIALTLCDWVIYFFQISPEYEKAIIKTFSSTIEQGISESTTEGLIAWAEAIKKFETKNLNFENSKKWLKVKYSIELSSLTNKMVSEPTKPNIKQSTRLIMSAQSLNLDIQTFIDIATGLICELVIDQNDLRDLKSSMGEQVARDLQFMAEIVFDLKQIKGLEEGNKLNIELIDYKIRETYPNYDKSTPVPLPVQQHSKNTEGIVNPDYLKKANHAEVIDEVLKAHGIDFNRIVYENMPLYAQTSSKFNVSVFRGRLPDGSLIALKSYTALVNSADLNLITEEIKILTIVSNRASDKNCFLKFYGSSNQSNTVYLYMEAGQTNLMNLITNWKTQKYYPDSEFLKVWIVSLILSFAELSYIRVYHRDIKPHNIIVTSDWKLKIIDFSVSKISEEIEASLCPTRSDAIQGTKGYMAPELEEMLAKNQKEGAYSPGKADVFSLGLTILQLITYQDLTTLNIASENPRLLKLVEELNQPNWIKILLRNMLQLDRKARPSFHQCLRFVPAEITKTLTNI